MRRRGRIFRIGRLFGEFQGAAAARPRFELLEACKPSSGEPSYAACRVLIGGAERDAVFRVHASGLVVRADARRPARAV